MSDLCCLNTIGIRPPGEKKTLELSKRFGDYSKELATIRKRMKDPEISKEQRRILLERKTKLNNSLIPGVLSALATSS